MDTPIDQIQQEIDDLHVEHDFQSNRYNDCMKRGDELGAQIHLDNIAACGKPVQAARRRRGELLDKMSASVKD
jgi:hypothetical protein